MAVAQGRGRLLDGWWTDRVLPGRAVGAGRAAGVLTRGRPGGLRRWPVWGLRPWILAVLVAVELVAVAVVVIGALVTRPGPAALLGAVGLAVLGILHTELATGIERVRRRVAHSSYFDLSSVWTFAAALLLPAPLAAGTVVLIYLHLWLRVWRPSGARLYRHVYTTATVVLACQAAGWMVTPAELGSSSPLAYAVLLAAMLVYVLLNQALVALALVLTADRHLTWRDLVGDGDDHILEGATLCLAVLAAVAVVRQPVLVVLVLPPLLVLHRAVLIRQLEERADTDAKTGLLTAAAWRGRADRVLQRAERARSAVAVLILDLDHFKTVNDTHGHLAGDEVLSAVASSLIREVRDGDLVGRFGGEEFVILLAGLPESGAGRLQSHAAAERIRRTIRTLRVPVETPNGPLAIADLSVSVGAALSGTDGRSMEELMQVADFALYAAKRAGRNQVRLGRPGQQPV